MRFNGLQELALEEQAIDMASARFSCGFSCGFSCLKQLEGTFLGKSRLAATGQDSAEL